MLKQISFIALLMLHIPFAVSDGARQPTVIKVGAYEFPPFFESNNGHYNGITPLLVDAFNDIQNDYTFKLTLTSPKRRYIDFERGRIQMLFFEDPKWGWKGYPVITSNQFLKGGEVFIAKNSNTNNTDIFDTITQRSIAAMLGYHYRFANWNSDSRTLQQQFNITLLSHSDAIIKQVTRGKSEIGIVSKAFLDRELYRNPNLGAQLLISDFYDQEYSHRIMLAEDANIDIQTVNNILKKLYDSGKLTDILSKFGLSPSPL